MCVRDIFEDVLQLTNRSVVQRLEKVSQNIHCQKGQILLETGELQTHVPMLIQGVVRGFLLDAEGRDITDCFAYCCGDILMGCNSLDEPSQINMEAMTDCEILTVPVSEVLALMEISPELLRIYNRYLVKALNRHWEGKILMHQYSAMQRYQWFLKHYPGLIERVSNKHIASFLGMTPVTLSRLRRQLRNEQPAGKGVQGEE